MLGILTLDTSFPRIRGDVGCAATFDFPVGYATVAGAAAGASSIRASDDAAAFVARGTDARRRRAAIGIATTCGFLARWQRELARELACPVLTSSLLHAPLVRACCRAAQGRRRHVLGRRLTPRSSSAARRPAYTPVEASTRRATSRDDPPRGRRLDTRDGGRRRRRCARSWRAPRRRRDRARMREHAALSRRRRGGDRLARVRRRAARRWFYAGSRARAARSRRDLW
jgi:hypothetical protein